MTGRFRDRRAAGRALAARLAQLSGRTDLLVLGLPRGGVPVAFEVARSLHAPLDVFVVRKLGVPGQEELAMGAIASGGTRVVNDVISQQLGIPESVLRAVEARESRELRRRETLYRGARGELDVKGRTVVLVDDGVATGSSMLAAIAALRSLHPAGIVVAVPVCAVSVADRLRERADDVICVVETDILEGVSFWYVDFDQTSDNEVRRLLDDAARTGSPESGAG